MDDYVTADDGTGTVHWTKDDVRAFGEPGTPSIDDYGASPDNAAATNVTAINAAIGCLADRDRTVRLEAARALAHIGGDPAMDAWAAKEAREQSTASERPERAVLPSLIKKSRALSPDTSEDDKSCERHGLSTTLF